MKLYFFPITDSRVILFIKNKTQPKLNKLNMEIERKESRVDRNEQKKKHQKSYATWIENEAKKKSEAKNKKVKFLTSSQKKIHKKSRSIMENLKFHAKEFWNSNDFVIFQESQNHLQDIKID